MEKQEEKFKRKLKDNQLISKSLFCEYHHCQHIFPLFLWLFPNGMLLMLKYNTRALGKILCPLYLKIKHLQKKILHHFEDLKGNFKHVLNDFTQPLLNVSITLVFYSQTNSLCDLIMHVCCRKVHIIITPSLLNYIIHFKRAS